MKYALINRRIILDPSIEFREISIWITEQGGFTRFYTEMENNPITHTVGDCNPVRIVYSPDENTADQFVDFVYNDKNLILRKTIQHPFHQTRINLKFDYNGKDYLTWIMGDSTPEESSVFEYDNRGRLIRVQEKAITNRFDTTGRITYYLLDIEFLTHDGRSGKSRSEVSNTYNASGFLIERKRVQFKDDGITADEITYERYLYNEFNRLIEYHEEFGEPRPRDEISTFQYDNSGKIIQYRNRGILYTFEYK